jgi:hypothetical protein
MANFYVSNEPCKMETKRKIYIHVKPAKSDNPRYVDQGMNVGQDCQTAYFQTQNPQCCDLIFAKTRSSYVEQKTPMVFGENFL